MEFVTTPHSFLRASTSYVFLDEELCVPLLLKKSGSISIYRNPLPWQSNAAVTFQLLFPSPQRQQHEHDKWSRGKSSRKYTIPPHNNNNSKRGDRQFAKEYLHSPRSFPFNFVFLQSSLSATEDIESPGSVICSVTPLHGDIFMRC